MPTWSCGPQEQSYCPLARAAASDYEYQSVCPGSEFDQHANHNSRYVPPEAVTPAALMTTELNTFREPIGSARPTTKHKTTGHP